MSRDTIVPDREWKFDQEVTAVFDDMLARSIPQYDVMRRAVRDIALRNLPQGGTLVDLGCSRGESMREIIASRPDGKYIGVEISDPMIEAARANLPTADIRKLDLRTDYPGEMSDVTLSILSLQFTPIEYRHKIMRQIYERTNVFILVEKVLGATFDTNELITTLYYELKGENGYSPDQIERKRLSLEGVLVPVTAEWNELLLKSTGFRQVECFWRWMNFAGWIAIK